MNKKQRIISGIQATGEQMHLGNYLGAVKRWTEMQNHYDSLFFIADLHAITIDRDPSLLRKATISMAAQCLANGIDPGQSTIFVQSSVPEHSELCWILGCNISVGHLMRMTQFKDKAKSNGEPTGLGLLAYPVLMSADILLYDVDLVPVGDDQKQHLELTRDIADNMNRKYNKTIFKLPEPYIKQSAKRIMSLKDANKKMSKSDPSEISRINLSDDNDLIRQKIRKAQTDNISQIYQSPERLAINNLINIYTEVTGQPPIDIQAEFENKNFSSFKEKLADVIISELEPVRSLVDQYLKDESYLISILREGANKARSIANDKLNIVKEEIGFLF